MRLLRITFVPDTTAFMTEVEAKYPEYLTRDEDGVISGVISGVSIIHTPLKKNDNGSLAYSWLNEELLAVIEAMTTIESLGDYDEMFADSVALNKYKSVYPYHIPIVYTDDDGVEQSYMLPERIGVFA